MSSEWKAKRFWKETVVVPEDDGFAVELDGRRVKTPAKSALQLPTRQLADAVAVEWDAQQGEINPLEMPFTRSVNAAIDKVAHQHGEVADMLAGYGDCDLLCYRAESPAELVEYQARQWDPALDWACEALGVKLAKHYGVMHQPQALDDVSRLSVRVHAMTNFQLAGFHDLVCLSGSLILGFGAAMDWRDTVEIWQISQLDELWQQEQWGVDDEAQAMSRTKKKAFVHAKRFFDLC